MKKRHPLALPLKRVFIIALVAMHRGMLLNSLWS
jgi:hypothetical protein